MKHQGDFKKLIEDTQQRCTENPLKHLRFDFLQKHSTAESRSLLLQKMPSWMFGKVLNMPLRPSSSSKLDKVIKLFCYCKGKTQVARYITFNYPRVNNVQKHCLFQKLITVHFLSRTNFEVLILMIASIICWATPSAYLSRKNFVCVCVLAWGQGRTWSKVGWLSGCGECSLFRGIFQQKSSS